jgi:hypothetical protein
MSELSGYDPFLDHPELRKEAELEPVSPETKAKILDFIKKKVEENSDFLDPKIPPPYEYSFKKHDNGKTEITLGFLPERFNLKELPLATVRISKKLKDLEGSEVLTYDFIRTPESIEMEKSHTISPVTGDIREDLLSESDFIKQISAELKDYKKIESQEKQMGLGLVTEKEARELLDLISESI